MKVVAISDTHGFHDKMVHPIPEADLLIHSGDFTTYGHSKEVKKFNAWLSSLPCRHKVVIAGNHDRCCECRTPQAVQALLTNARYLQDSAVTIDGIKIYGSPYTPTFFDWAFMLDRGPDLADKWQQIPDDTDILVTHGPPMGKLDWSIYGKQHVGCEALRDRIEAVKPKFHVFGHIHYDHGYTRNADTEFFNACICNEAYIPANDPCVFEVSA